MNRAEAKQLLIERLQPYVGRSYRDLSEFVGSEHVEKITMASGIEYYFQLDVAPINEDKDALIVDGIVTEVHGRRFLPPTEQATFTITPDDKICHISPELQQSREEAEHVVGGNGG
jgi:hypothetical protein